jgi:hypothetical protein
MRANRLLLAVTFALAGCPKQPASVPPPPPAVVNSFTATPTMIANSGDMVTLAWDTKDAKRVLLEQLGHGQLPIDNTLGSGTLQLAITSDSTFVLTAIGEGGTDSAVQTVTLNGGSSTLLFDASPKTVDSGRPTTLVWNAPGAMQVTIKDASGTALDLRGQKSSGSLTVTPTASTHYDLDADGRAARVDITVNPAILSFTAGPSPAAGQPVPLEWRTTGGTRLTLTRAGATMPVLVETDPARIATGMFSDTAPASLPVDGLLSYQLDLDTGTTKLSAQLTVRIGGALKISRFTVPGFVKTGNPYSISWATTSATYLEVRAGGQVVYVAPDAATAASGGTTLPAFSGATAQVQLLVRNDRGGELTDVRTVEVVGAPVFVSFTADKNMVASGGQPVVLSWNVTNARSVRIEETGGGTVYATSGHVDTGNATVYPNRATSVYTLTAGNAAGDTVMPQTVMVTVTAVASLTFERQLPVGATAKVTGHTVPGGTDVWGLPVVVKNAPGDSFVDISTTGIAADHSTDYIGTFNSLGETFSTRIFGRRVSMDGISISPDGWFFFSPAAYTGSIIPTAAFVTETQPLAIAPFYGDLYVTPGVSEIYLQLDTVGNERRLIVQWTNVSDYATKPGSTAAAVSHYTFQAQVYSGGKIVLAYQTVDKGSGSFSPAHGIVNGSQNAGLSYAMAPQTGDVFTFFGQSPLPVSFMLENAPYVARVAVGTGFVDVEGDGRLPPGQFGLTEANPRPGTGITNGEWLEVTNFTSTAFDLNGWTLSFGAGNTHVINTSVQLPPMGRVVLAQATDLGDPSAGITATYVYPSTLAMNDTSGTVSLVLAGVVYSSLSWDATSLTGAGISVRTDPPPSFGTLLGSVSCSGAGSGTYGTQTGSPGTAGTGARCVPYALSALPAGNFESISATGTKASGATADENVYPIALATPIQYYGAPVSTLYVSSNGWISTTSTTSAALTNKTTPNTSAPVGSIAPFWDDLQNGAATGTGVYWQQKDPDMTPGTGDEYTIVSWEHWSVFAATGQDLNFEVKFFANGNIEYHFGAMTGTGGTNQGSSATTWLEDRSGKAAFAVNVNAPGVAPNTGYRFAYGP